MEMVSSAPPAPRTGVGGGTGAGGANEDVGAPAVREKDAEASIGVAGADAVDVFT